MPNTKLNELNLALELRPALARAAESVRSRVRATVEVETGALRSSVRVEKGRSFRELRVVIGGGQIDYADVAEDDLLIALNKLSSADF